MGDGAKATVAPPLKELARGQQYAIMHMRRPEPYLLGVEKFQTVDSGLWQEGHERAIRMGVEAAMIVFQIGNSSISRWRQLAELSL